MILSHDKLVLRVRLTRIVLLYKCSGTVFVTRLDFLHLDRAEDRFSQFEDEQSGYYEDGGDAHRRDADRRYYGHAGAVVFGSRSRWGFSIFHRVHSVHREY